MANGILSQLPSLTSAIDAQETLTNGFSTLTATLPDDTSSLIAPLTTGLGSLAEAIPDEPAALVAPLETSFDQFLEQLSAGQIPAIQTFQAQFTEVFDILAPLQDVLASADGLRDLRDVVFEQAGDPISLVNSLIAEFNTLIPTESLEVLQTFVNTLQTFEANLPSDPTEVATFLAQSFLGVPLDLLAAPLSLVEGMQADIAGLLDATQVEAFETALQTTATQFRTLATQLRTLDLTDAAAYPSLQTGVTAAQGHLTGVQTQLTQLVNDFQTGLSSLNVEGLNDNLQQTLENVPEVKVAQVDDFLQLVLTPIQQITARLDALTPEALTQRLRDANSYLDDVIQGQGFDEIQAGLLKPFNAIGEAIASLNLDQFRDAIADFFGTLGDGITSITSQTDGVKTAIQAACDQIDSVLASLETGGDQVETLISDVGTAIESAIAAIPLEAFRDQVMNLLNQVQGLIASFGPVLDDALDQVSGLIGQLEDIDFRQFAEPIIEAIRSLEATLESINENLLSEAELSAFRVSAGVLSNIDLGPVRTEILNTFDQVHPGNLVNELLAKYQALTDKLADYNPANLLTPLAEPFNHVKSTLDQYNPATLIDPVLDQIESFTQQLGGLDQLITQAIAPLTQLFEALQQAMADLSPSQLLTPLTQQFANIMALFDKLDITPFLDELEGMFSQWLQQALGGLQNVGDGFNSAGDLKTYLDPDTPDPADDTLGFMPGDILRPVEDVYNKVVGALTQIPEATLVDAFNHLKGQFVEALATIAPLNLSAQIASDLQQQLARFDFTQRFDLVADVYSAYGELLLALDSIDIVQVPAALQTDYFQIAGTIPSLNPDLTLADFRPTFQSLNRNTLRLTTGLNVGKLAAAFGPLSEQLTGLIPPFLQETLSLENIQAHLEILNPGRLADEVNQVYEQFAVKTAQFGDVFVAELPPILDRLSANTTGFLPTLLKQAFGEIYNPLKAQLEALNPAGIIADLEADVYTPLVTALDSLHPDTLLAELDLSSKTQGFTNIIDGIITSLRGLQTTISEQWGEILSALDLLNPLNLQAPLNDAFEQIRLATTLDPQDILDQLDRLVAHIREDLERVLLDVETALSEMLAAAPT
ncbi:hypothetical protein XM38_032750 [Halomicronema hongdechloris C2206]|uniref:Uncharacterized protein n=1 Tax=Halomicronema hongdechloris C2206 TaxID=1641165 RepID=A0A1Z3HPT0_9CYAN|nr:hypothetical protein [Halomicronema hongdechloris]ASC72318.1 hypothetical protein XM38_032750 [Halomicronema hongdechloris C2206]